MKRKVVQHGPSTLIISLPSNWIKKNDVSKGDELEVKEEGKTLTVSKDEILQDSSITKDVSNFDPLLVNTFLVRAYQKGYDKINLIHNNVEVLKKIQTKTLELIGYEIIEQNNKYCLIQSISSHIELDFDNSLRKAFIITKQMLEIAIKAYKEKDNPTLEGLQIMDLEVNRFCNFCLRQINKEQYIGTEQAQQSHTLYYLIEILEELGDVFKRMALYLASSKRKNLDIVNLMQLLFEQYDAAYSYFYKSTADKANQAYRTSVMLDDEITKILDSNKLTTSEILVVYSIMDSVHIISHFTTTRLDFLKDSEQNALNNPNLANAEFDLFADRKRKIEQ
jgi:phosphate uptake regulator